MYLVVSLVTNHLFKPRNVQEKQYNQQSNTSGNQNIQKMYWLLQYVKHTIQLVQPIPDTKITHTGYCYPEYNAKRKCVETTLLDPTHLLTKMQTHCSTKQMDDCLASDFKWVSRADNDVLSQSILDLMLDKQSADIALKFFSVEVGKNDGEIQS